MVSSVLSVTLAMCVRPTSVRNNRRYAYEINCARIINSVFVPGVLPVRLTSYISGFSADFLTAKNKSKTTAGSSGTEWPCTALQFVQNWENRQLFCASEYSQLH